MAYKEHFIKTIPELYEKLIDFSNHGGELWYRGVKKHKYELKPSAYRSAPFKANGKILEHNAYLTAKSAMMHLQDVERLSTDLDWFCFLQHYGTPTRLLDWTYELQVAIYFAFADYIEGTAIAGSMPTLWAIKPHKFITGLRTYLTTAINPFGLALDPTKTKALSNFFKDGAELYSQQVTEEEIHLPELHQIYVPFISSYVNPRAMMQGASFIRFPVFDPSMAGVYDDYFLEKFVTVQSGFDDCLAKFVFTAAIKMRDELTILNLSTTRNNPEVKNIATSIGKRIFEI